MPGRATLDPTTNQGAEPMLRALRGRTRLQVAGVATAAVLLVGSLALFGVGLRQLIRYGRPSSDRLRMLTDPVPNRQVLSGRIAAEAGRRGLTIERSDRAYASLDGLGRVDAGKEVDVGLVPGGVGSSEQFPHVRQVATLGTDPLHLMVRPGLEATASRGLGALRGRRINCGPPASVLRVLAHDVLRFAGLEPPAGGRAGDFVDEAVASQDLLARLDALRSLRADERARSLDALPDAVLFLSPLPSLLARRLASAGYRLVPLTFTEAYALDRLNLGDDRAPAEGAGTATVDRSTIVATTIPAELYGMDPPMPAAPCRTLGTRLLLVAHEKADPDSIARLLEVLYEGPITALIRPDPLADQALQFERHAGTTLFLRRREPAFTPEMMGQLGRLAGGLGAFASGMVGVYGFLRILQLRRFEAYYRDVRRIAQVGRGLEDDPAAPDDPSARRLYLLDRLDDLKAEAVRDFAEGGLKGEGLLAGVVALVNDTRNSLLAHERRARDDRADAVD